MFLTYEPVQAVRPHAGRQRRLLLLLLFRLFIKHVHVHFLPHIPVPASRLKYMISGSPSSRFSMYPLRTNPLASYVFWAGIFDSLVEVNSFFVGQIASILRIRAVAMPRLLYSGWTTSSSINSRLKNKEVPKIPNPATLLDTNAARHFPASTE